MKRSIGAIAYAAYSAAVGNKTFDGKPLPEFKQLGDPQRDGWARAAQTGGFACRIGSEVVTVDGVVGKVESLIIAKHDKRGVWLDCRDSTGRPFQHYADESEIAYVDQELVGGPGAVLRE